MIKIPQKFESLFIPSRLKLMWGGRAGAKSETVARVLLYMGMQQKLHILCTRDVQDSIKQSVHALLKHIISTIPLMAKFYRVKYDEIDGANGTNFFYAGVRTDPEKMKSTHQIDICWIEEAEKMSADTFWRILSPTVRAHNSEIWVTFNPESSDSLFWSMVQSPPDDAIIINTNFYDNPFISNVVWEDAAKAYQRDPESFRHIWLGEPRQYSDVSIFKKWVSVEPFEPVSTSPTHTQWVDLHGADFSRGGNDPHALVKMTRWKDCLYIHEEAYGYADIADLPDLFLKVPRIRDASIAADSANPDLIKYCRNNGLSGMYSVKKTGVIEGIHKLRQYDKIIIHPRCENVAREMLGYKWKTDKNGNILTDPVDHDNHTIDAIRYADTQSSSNRTYYTGTAF